MTKLKPKLHSYSDYRRTNEKPENVLDGHTDTYWYTNTVQGWLVFDFEKTVPIAEITIRSVAVTGNTHSIKKFEILVSDDGENFTKIFEADNHPNNENPVTYQLPSINARYLKFQNIETYALGTGLIEVEFTGHNKKYLIQDGEVIKIYKEDLWWDIGLYPITESQFEEGMTGLSIINKNKLELLNSKRPKVLCKKLK